MRDRKRKLLAGDPEVAAINKNRKTTASRAQPGPVESFDVDGADDDEDKPAKQGRVAMNDADVEREEMGEDAVSSKQLAPMHYAGTTSDRRHGCAGCATGGGRESLALALLVAGLLARRRRRA
jgi:MYXO-CTERM domain-containing protein